MSLQFRILFALFFLSLAGAGLLLWLILAWGNGFWAMAAPLGVGGALTFVGWVVLRGAGNGPSHS